MGLPDEVVRYGEALTSRLSSRFPDRLAGCYFAGSLALGGYLPGRSDIDAVAVVEGRVSAGEKEDLAACLAHPRLLCPARALEFVLYEAAMAAAPRADGAFALNFVTGPGAVSHFGADPTAEPAFWFVIDRAIVRAHGVVLFGPPPAALFAPLPRSTVLGALLESLRWHRSAEPLGHNTALNATRAWRYALEGVFGPKAESATWARRRWRDPEVIDAALALRRGENVALPAAGLVALLDHVEQVLRRQAGSGRGDPGD